jgi:hypothetical protein
MTLPLRLAISLKAVASMLAQRDGVLWRKDRLESEILKEHETVVKRAKFVAASEHQ